MQRTVSEAGLGAQLLADGENESFLNVFGKLSLLRWSELFQDSFILRPANILNLK